MIKHKELEKKIIEIIAVQSGIDKIHNDISIKNSFKEVNKDFDELDLVEIVMGIEDELDICVLDEKADKWNKIEDIMKYVSGKIEIEPDHIPFTRFEIMDI